MGLRHDRECLILDVMAEPDYHKIRINLAQALKRDALLHERAKYMDIGQGFLNLRSLLRHGGDHRFQKLIVAMKFWDGWILARNTDWLEYPDIPERRWSELAKTVAADLEADREISSFQVRAQFDLEGTLELPKQLLRSPNEVSPLDDP